MTTSFAATSGTRVKGGRLVTGLRNPATWVLAWYLDFPRKAGIVIGVVRRVWVDPGLSDQEIGSRLPHLTSALIIISRSSLEVTSDSNVEPFLPFNICRGSKSASIPAILRFDVP